MLKAVVAPTVLLIVLAPLVPKVNDEGPLIAPDIPIVPVPLVMLTLVFIFTELFKAIFPVTAVFVTLELLPYL